MKLLLTTLAALSLCGPAVLRAQAPAAPAAPAAAASAPVITVRPEVANAINAAVELHQAKKTAEALARVEKALADVPTLSPVETAVLQRTRGLLALSLEQFAPGIQALEAALATNVLSKNDQLLATEALVRASYNVKNYKATLDWAAKAKALGSTWQGLPLLVTRSLYLTDDFAGTVRDIEARMQANPALPEDELRILASSYGKVGNEAGYTRTVERLLREHPRPEYWPDLLARVQRQPGWQQRYEIDLYRLRLQVDAMDDPSDYLVLAEAASRAGLPAEAQAVLEAGFAKGMLGKGSGAGEQQKLRAAVTKQASDDRPSLQAAAGRAPAVTDARTAATALTTGAALVSVGQNDRGLDYMKAALAGSLPDPAQARLQYAVALHKSGKSAEAMEAFKALANHESLGLIARLWTIALTPKKG